MPTTDTVVPATPAKGGTSSGIHFPGVGAIKRLLRGTASVTAESSSTDGDTTAEVSPQAEPAAAPAPASSARTTARPEQAILAIETPSGSPKTHHEPVRPQRSRRYTANPIAEPKPFDFESARLELFRLLELRRDGERVSYDVRDILRRAILDHDGMATMFVYELVRRITRQTEKRYDMVVTIGEYGAIFGARIADALIAKYGQGHDVAQRFLELFLPSASEGVPHPLPEYRLQRTRSEKGYLLSSKRVVFAVPVVTPETWPEVLQQVTFLRSEQANSAEVSVVAIARIGHLETDAPTGLTINAIIDFR